MSRYQERAAIIGARIKEERNKLNLSVKEFLLKIYKSEQSHKTVSAWENGERLPDLESLSRMADLFQCDIGYLLGDYPEKTKELSDICAITGLSAAAVNVLIGDKRDGFRNIRVEALNFLLTSVNFENALHDLVEFKHAEKEAASLEKAKKEAISNLSDINEYHPKAEFLNLIAAMRQTATLCEYNLSKNFTFVIEELKRKVDEEVSKHG